MIDILLATYNGERYIETQIRSLQAQTYRQWRLLVHDDGSTDHTLDIVRRLAADDVRISLLDDGVQFHSAAQNFLHLIRHSTAPFCICCDGDDVWLAPKLERLYSEILRHDNARPQAVWCNSYVYDPETCDISGWASLCIMRELRDVLFCNGGIQGCAILFNAALRDIVVSRTPAKVAMHDHVLTLAATAFGEFTYVPQRLMLYRRHRHAVTGHTDRTKAERASRFMRPGVAVLDRRHYEATRSFYDTNADYLPAEAKRLMLRFFDYENHNRLWRALHAPLDGFRLYSRRSYLAMKLLLRPLVGSI